MVKQPKISSIVCVAMEMKELCILSWGCSTIPCLYGARSLRSMARCDHLRGHDPLQLCYVKWSKIIL